MMIDLTQKPTALLSSWPVLNKWVRTGVAAESHPTAEYHRGKRLRIIDASIAEGKRASGSTEVLVQQVRCSSW